MTMTSEPTDEERADYRAMGLIMIREWSKMGVRPHGFLYTVIAEHGWMEPVQICGCKWPAWRILKSTKDDDE